MRWRRPRKTAGSELRLTERPRVRCGRAAARPPALSALRPRPRWREGHGAASGASHAGGWRPHRGGRHDARTGRGRPSRGECRRMQGRGSPSQRPGDGRARSASSGSARCQLTHLSGRRVRVP